MLPLTDFQKATIASLPKRGTKVESIQWGVERVDGDFAKSRSVLIKSEGSVVRAYVYGRQLEAIKPFVGQVEDGTWLGVHVGYTPKGQSVTRQNMVLTAIKVGDVAIKLECHPHRGGKTQKVVSEADYA